MSTVSPPIREFVFSGFRDPFSDLMMFVCLPHAAMTLSGKAYFDAVSKVGENAIVSPVSRELGEFQASRGYIQHLQW